MRFVVLTMAVVVSTPACAAERWKPIFNGRNLDGWVAKVNHRPLGDNGADIFTVKDGVLHVSHAGYERFTDQFAHLIYKRKLSSYRLRLEYRFTGPPPPGAQAWAFRNSGVMLHGQAPEEMALDQPYPISIEAQFLGGNTEGDVRHTGNVCTPGTTIAIAGVDMKEHCRDSASPTYRDGQWVKAEVEVHGGRLIRQYIEGQLTFEYTNVRLDPSEFKRFGNIDPGDAKPGPLTSGYISLQGESSPVEFRRIELMELKE